MRKRYACVLHLLELKVYLLPFLRLGKKGYEDGRIVRFSGN